MEDSLHPGQEEEVELSHSDKAVGLFTEPSKTFGFMSKFPPKAADWLLPLLVVIIIASLSNVVLMSNPAIKRQIIEKQLETSKESLSNMIKEGKMTESEAQQALDNQQTMMEQGGAFFMVIGIVGIIVVSFIAFFIIAGVFYLIGKVALKGDGTFSSAMVATGLPYYIYGLQAILVIILSLAFGRMFTGTSVGAFADMDKATLAGYFLGKIDVVSIWAITVTSIGLSKMFKIADTKKVIITVFAVWIGWSVIAFGLSQLSPFLKFFSNM